MKKRKGKNSKLKTVFLACEFKPNTRLFSVLDPFTYDIQPAFIHGSLGVISYRPNAYSIVDADEKSQPILGYIMTITEPDTITLLNKIKGYNGKTGFNFHTKKVVEAYTSVNESQKAWVYILSDAVLDQYETLQQIENFWDEEDENLVNFLERIGEEM